VSGEREDFTDLQGTSSSPTEVGGSTLKQ